MHIDMVDEKTSTGSKSKTNMTSLSDCFLSTDQSNDRLGGVAFSAPRSPIESSARSKHKSGRHLAEDKLNLPQNNCLQDDFFAESEDQFKRIGDVKLFGQILTHPSSQKPCFLQEGDIIPASSRQNSSANTNLPGSWKDASIFPLRPGSNGFLQQGDSTKSGYSLWEGNRLRMGLSSLPESAIILAKYQGTLPGIPFCSIKDGHSECNTGMPDYKQQAYMESLSANKKPSLSANKKLLDGFPELVERRNVFDVMPSRQQHGRMLPMGRNVVGGGAIVVGGAAVSDPVASLQVHYSGGRAKILAGDVEQWVGDVGGR
ncbi:hypothetical protein HPP92_006489 [Vanilla planifolia]|uniref:Uncharacterized protein n=1 Tax=Vanilla planifolia TaxID=51239 RepID=A0A835VAZ5_VANPL|nr:hypothetical protein HPP92_006489 [Vanilla planifolia]